MSRASSRRGAAVSSSSTWPGALQPGDRRVGGADRAGADHGHGVVEPDGDVLVAADRVRQRVGERGVGVGQPLGDPEQVLERDLGDRHQLGVGALVVEPHQLAVARTGARCPTGRAGSGRTTASRCSAPGRRSERPLWAISSAAARADLDQLAADLMPQHPGRRDPAVAVVEGADVGAADPACGDAEQHAVGRARRLPRLRRSTSRPAHPRSLRARSLSPLHVGSVPA